MGVIKMARKSPSLSVELDANRLNLGTVLKCLHLSASSGDVEELFSPPSLSRGLSRKLIKKGRSL